MSRLSELIAKGKEHRVIFMNSKGKELFRLSLLWTVIIALAAPHAALAVLLGVLLEILDVEIEKESESGPKPALDL